LGAKNKKE